MASAVRGAPALKGYITPGNIMIKRLPTILLIAAALPLAARAGVAISIDVAPPPLPVYAQPTIPAAGYLWTPGYWRWSPNDGEYFWVPGTWVAPPYVGALWTPGYWGWGGGGYAWHGGYWGDHIGFYGGVNYGFGYIGHGYEGGYWNGGVFNYNRSVNNVNTTIVHNTYNTTVVHNDTHVSYNGGQGGVAARPTPEEQAARAEQHTPPTPLQRQHEQVAMRSPEQRMSVNHGNPGFAASPRPVAMNAAHVAHVTQGADHMGGQPGPEAHGAAMHEGGHPPAMAHAGPPHAEHHQGGHEGGHEH